MFAAVPEIDTECELLPVTETPPPGTLMLPCVVLMVTVMLFPAESASETRMRSAPLKVNGVSSLNVLAPGTMKAGASSTAVMLMVLVGVPPVLGAPLLSVTTQVMVRGVVGESEVLLKDRKSVVEGKSGELE